MDQEKSKQAFTIIQREMALHKKVCIHPQGFSMWPFLKEDQDSVIVKPLPASSMHRGDILLYRRSNQILVLHRLHHKNRKGFFMTGDNQTQIEGPVLSKDILGVVTTIHRGQHTFSRFHPIWLLASHLWLLFRPVKPFAAYWYHKIHTKKERRMTDYDSKKS